jgi:hypoxanthine phosphoribosyltransferase
MQSYDYAHRQGVEEISWERFASLAAVLAERLVGIEAVVGIARAGLFPATAVACTLRRELYPVRVTRRVNDQVTHRHPVWKVPVSPEVEGKIVAVVDEVTDTGETLALVAEQVKATGAKQVITASLISHTWAKPMPDHVALVTDALVIFPWDKQVFMDGRWQIHPELEEALRLQGKGDNH